MTGVFLSVRRGSMIRIDFFFGRLPRGVRRPLGPLGHLFSAVVLTFLAGISIQFILLFGGDRALYLEIPRGYSSAALVVGGLASTVAFLVVLAREYRKSGDDRDRSGDRHDGRCPAAGTHRMIGAAASILVLCILLVLRAPMMVSIAAAVILNFFLSGAWALTLPQTMLSGMNRFVLIALPLFMLAAIALPEIATWLPGLVRD